MPTLVEQAFHPYYLLANRAGNQLELAGRSWIADYFDQGDGWACVGFGIPSDTSLRLSQCVFLVSEKFNAEATKQDYLNEGYEELTVELESLTYGESLVLGKFIDGDGQLVHIVSNERLMVLILFGLSSTDSASLEQVFETRVEQTTTALALMTFQRSMGIGGPTPTPISAFQQSFYATLSERLLTEEEANTIFAPSVLEYIGDAIGKSSYAICRDFEDRSQPYDSLVVAHNCIFLSAGLDIEDILGLYDDVHGVVQVDELESGFASRGDQELLVGFLDPATQLFVFDLWVWQGDYLYKASIKILGYVSLSTPVSLFSKKIDTFLNDIITVNLAR
ncbi:MAG: hypothetical protein EPO32_12690 [Anaerolineae bacterium]|nr:MAG: hypothetical protein EPO32_12690 [Anaerolineae bacterium]